VSLEVVSLESIFVALLIINLCNLFGMFVEQAGDEGAINWFAKGFLISVITCLGGFLLISLIRLF